MKKFNKFKITAMLIIAIIAGYIIQGYATGAFINQDNLFEPEEETAFYDLSSEHWAYESILYLKQLGIVSGDGEGYFHPEASVTRSQFVKMLVMAVGVYDRTSTSKFIDVSVDKWHYPYISSLFKGAETSGNFRPDEEISREDMAFYGVMAAEKAKIDLSPSREMIAFSDQEEISDYAKNAVTVMQQAGIINGMSDGIFAPKGTATRAQAAKIIYEPSMRI